MEAQRKVLVRYSGCCIVTPVQSSGVWPTGSNMPFSRYRVVSLEGV